MLTSIIGAKTLSGYPKPEPSIRPSLKPSYEPAETFRSRFRGRLLKNPVLVHFFNFKLPKWEFSSQINSELLEIQFRPRVQSHNTWIEATHGLRLLNDALGLKTTGRVITFSPT